MFIHHSDIPHINLTVYSYLLAKTENRIIRGSNSLDGYFYGAFFILIVETFFVIESFGRTHEKPNAYTVCNSPFLFKEKQLTWRHENWTTKPQQGERNGLKDELGGMSYPSLCWLLGAENVYWYRDLGDRDKEVWSTGTGGLQKCFWNWENMSMNCRNENRKKK